MKKSWFDILIVLAMLAVSVENAWAGVGTPEVPADFAPFFAMGIAGVAYGIRALCNRDKNKK